MKISSYSVSKLSILPSPFLAQRRDGRAGGGSEGEGSGAGDAWSLPPFSFASSFSRWRREEEEERTNARSGLPLSCNTGAAASWIYHYFLRIFLRNVLVCGAKCLLPVLRVVPICTHFVRLCVGRIDATLAYHAPPALAHNCADRYLFPRGGRDERRGKKIFF